MTTTFEKLLTGLCVLTGNASPQRLVEGGGFEFHGVRFALSRKIATDPDGLFLHADFGQLDLEDQAAIYPLLLQENLMMMSSRDRTFSVSRPQDCVVMIERLCLSAQTPQSLLHLLQSLACKANYFNKHRRTGKSVALRRHCN